MKEKIFELMLQKKEVIKKLQMEIDVLLFAYHSISNEEDINQLKKSAYEELIKMQKNKSLPIE
jgi:hypothetical protein